MTKEPIDLNTAPAVKDAATWVEVDGEVVIYDEDTAAMHLLDPIATSVWLLLDGVTSLAQTCHELAARFGADEGVVRRDVLALVQSFAEQGLVVTSGEAAARPGGR